MHTHTKHLGILVLAMASVIAIAFGAAAALADPAPWWPAGNTNTLTVAAVDDESEIAADVATCKVTVDVYRIATASPNPNYQAFDYAPLKDGPFRGLSIPTDPTAQDWQDLADQAAAIVLPEGASAFGVTPDASGAAGTAMSGLGDGLYLVLAHGQGVTDGLTAINGDYTKKYTFQPTVVALPSTASGTTDDPSGWTTDVAISLKPEEEPLYGDIRILKTLTAFAGTEPVTFTFHIKSTDDSPYEYENYVAITFNKGGSDNTTASTGTIDADRIDEKIPAGTLVTVEESYDGANYQLVEGDSSVKKIVSDEAIEAGAEIDGVIAAMPEAAFVNEPSDEVTKGYGVENEFKLSKIGEDDDAWDWVWTQLS